MISQAQREAIFKRDGKKCLKCGAMKELTIDHIVPIVLGGKDENYNLQTLCNKCNSWKGEKVISYRKGKNSQKKLGRR